MGITSFIPDTDDPKLKIALNYLNIAMKNQRLKHGIGLDEDLFFKNKNNYTEEFGGTNESDLIIPPSETASNDSFHSCHSFLSFAPTKHNDSGGTGKDIFPRRTKSPKGKDSGRKVTMVNAIFLSHGTGEVVKIERPKMALLKEKHSEIMKTAEVNLGPSSNIFKPFCTQAYSCNIDQPTGLENVNMSANETLLKGDFLKMNNTKVNKEDKEVGESFDSNETLLKKNEGDKYDLNMNVPREVRYRPQKNIVGADCRNNKSFAVDKAKLNSKQAVYNTKGIGSLEINNAKSLKITEPISDPAYNRNIFKCTLVQRKQAINTAYEVQSLEPIYPRVSSVVLTPEIDKPLFSPKRSSNNFKTYKEGNCEDEIIVNVPDKGRNSKITVGESYLRSLIKESFLKVKEEENYSIQNNVSSDGMFLEDSSGYGSEEETCDDDVGIDGFDSDDSFGSDVCFEHSNERGEICDFSCNDYQPTYFDTSGEEIDNPIQEECEETLAKGEGISRTNFDSEVFPYLRRSYKRRSSESPCNLPVIEEETSTSVLAPLSEEEFDLDYCLVDSNGKAIQLFDHNGLPLTDRRGRPLRTAKGEPLMKCDDDGIPLVDYNDCSVFDMFGRTPNHKDFDPAMAPKMPTFNRLAACDGKPLLLYDAQDRPLTSVSGTMLVDSSGRGLIRLATKPEDE